MDTLGDTYAVGELIGKGGFGEVFAGQRISDGIPVALKVILSRKVVYWYADAVSLQASIADIPRNV